MDKKYIKSILLCVFFSLTISQVSVGQTLKAFIAAAENSFIQKDYYSALIYYSDALEFEQDRIDLIFKTGESARLFNAYSLAEEKYQKVVDMDTDASYPMAVYWLADIKQKLGKYKEARDLYSLYLSESEDDAAYYTERSKKEVKACDWAIDLVMNPDTSLTIKHLGAGINTPYSEFGALDKEGDLYFSSKKYIEKNKQHFPDRLIAKILKAESDSAAAIVEGINRDDLHTAHTSFSNDGTRIFYTVCKYINHSDIRCDIFTRTIDEDGNFGEEEKLPEIINSAAFTCTQPAIGTNPETGGERLYFVSDQAGGKGKLDIWYSDIDSAFIFSEPVNMKDINTIENDISPFYHSNSDIIYFSSTGYQSLGGFDIYKSEYGADGFGQAIHMGTPLNTSYHDIYYSLDPEAELAYFSSNREGSLYLETEYEACCYDIYEVEYDEVIINLIALTFDKFSLTELIGVTVTLYDEDRNLIIDKVTQPESNEFRFLLEKDKNYLIIAEKSPFESDTIRLSTKRMYTSQDITKKLFLGLDMLELETLTFDKQTMEELRGVTVTLTNLTDSNVPEEIEVNLLSNDFHFQLERGKTYRLTAKRDKYKTTTISFDTNGPVDQGKIIKRLYLEKRDLNIYLPVKLFFDNDRPNRRSVQTKTRRTYTQTYHPFVGKKDEFKENYVSPTRGENRIVAEQQIEDFFEFDVRGGYEKFQLFLQALLTELEKGETLELSIRGFASPRAADFYNMAIGQRRVSSVRNELKKFEDAILIPYIDNGQLILTDISFGETMSPPGVSDDLNDRRNSVYSVEASRERRVEIIEVNNLEE
jgi:tetratricopeptide (TPR) repeat protein